MVTEVIVKKWGNSFGIILPRDLVEKESLKENKKIFIDIIKEADLSDIFGLVKKRMMSGQRMKDLSRKEWQ